VHRYVAMSRASLSLTLGSASPSASPRPEGLGFQCAMRRRVLVRHPRYRRAHRCPPAASQLVPARQEFPGRPGSTRTRTGAPPRRRSPSGKRRGEARMDPADGRLAKPGHEQDQRRGRAAGGGLRPWAIRPCDGIHADVAEATMGRLPCGYARRADYRVGHHRNSGRNSGSLDRICRSDRDHPERLGAEGARARLSDRRAGARTPPLHRPIRTSLAQASLAQVPAEVVVSVFCSCLAASRCPWNAGPTFSTKALSSAFLIAGSSVVLTASSTCW